MVKQASEYESKKQICYSLGILYDAMMLEKRNGISAIGTEKYNELSSIIRSGRPGRGSYNDFQYHEKKKNLLKKKLLTNPLGKKKKKKLD